MGQPIQLQARRMKSLAKPTGNVQLLEGNVRFQQSGSTVTCDQAEYDPATETLLGIGHVRIVNNEGTTVTGLNLFYDNREHIAKVSGQVELRDGSMTLTSPWLKYNTLSKEGWYGSGATILDRGSTLKSRSGRFNAHSKTLFFRYNVSLETPDYSLFTDTLEYQTDSKVARLYTYTQLEQDSSLLFFNRGWYSNADHYGEFYDQVQLVDPHNLLVCDTLYFHRNSKQGTALGHVWMLDRTNDWVLFASGADYAEDGGSKFWGRPLGRQLDSAEPFDLRSDSIFYRNDSFAHRWFKATGNVLFQRAQVSGRSHVLEYSSVDSAFRLSEDPVLYDSASRLSGEHIDLFMNGQRIERVAQYNEAFVVMHDGQDPFNGLPLYSQIKADSMNHYFREGKLHSMTAYRESQSLYYLKSEEQVDGVNSVSSRDMRFAMLDGKIDKVYFYGEPKGTVYPPDELPSAESRLPGFVWDPERKPTAEAFALPFEAYYRTPKRTPSRFQFRDTLDELQREWGSPSS